MFEPIVINDTEENSLVTVIIYLYDIDNSFHAYFYNSYKLFDKYYLTFYDNDNYVAIEELIPSAEFPGLYEPDREIALFNKSEKIEQFLYNFDNMTAADLISLIATEGKRGI